jgi:hypothetical protein
MPFFRKVFAKTWRVICIVVWIVLGAWIALAAFFTIPVPLVLSVLIALGIVGLFAFSLRERAFATGWAGFSWRTLPRTIMALAVTAGVAVWYFGFVNPRIEKWAPIHERMPHVEIKGDKVYVDNVRNFTWQTPTDFTPAYYDRVYDLNALNSMYFLVSPIMGLDPVAHVWVCFGFSDGKHVAVSVEARGVKDRPYGLLRSIFRQFQLIYVIGDERDIVGLRGRIWKNEVQFFPVRTTPERMRALFVAMMQRAHALEEEPEFYNLFTNNCMNNITDHIRALGGRPLPSDWRLILTGFSYRLAYDYGFIDTDLSLEQSRRAFSIGDWMTTADLDDSFSTRLRERLRAQEAEVASERP